MFWGLLCSEQGGATLPMMLVLTLLLIVFSLILANYAVLHATRRVAQTGADAAALAAASRLADRLTRSDFRIQTPCCRSNPCPQSDTLNAYLEHVRSQVRDRAATAGEARFYLQANGTELRRDVGILGPIPDGREPVRWGFDTYRITVASETASPLALAGLYGSDAQSVHGLAAAIVYPLAAPGYRSVVCRTEWERYRCGTTPTGAARYCTRRVRYYNYSLRMEWGTELVNAYD
jgi:hypothetical protein